MNQNNTETVLEKAKERYNKSEDFIMEYLGWSWWKRLLKGRKPLIDHLESIHKKYEDDDQI